MKTYYRKLHEDEYYWCETHKRRATYIFHGHGWIKIHCDPNLSGILMGCQCEPFSKENIKEMETITKERQKL